MKFTYNWLKDFVNIKIPAEKLADKLTMAGLEVVSLEERSADQVFEIEVTSNRPDWLSVFGIAREVAAIVGVKLKPSCVVRNASCAKNAKRRAQDARPLAVKVDNRRDCPLYTAKVITGVKVASSPGWMKKRLELVGLRSVNNIVDITNYAQLTWGEPLHAFDLDKIEGGVLAVRRAKKQERLRLIDGTQKELGPEELVIADAKKAIALAGIMGCEASVASGR